MPAFSITDSAGKPVDAGTMEWSQASSIANYAKSELLHLIVVPDYLSRKDQTLTAAAPKPLRFDVSVSPGFSLGGTSPEVTLKPSAKAELRIDAAVGSDLFEDDDFHEPALIPANIAYVGLAFTGSLSAGASVPSGDLSFGIDQGTDITFRYLKAFPKDLNQPTLGTATWQTLADFVIPANVADFGRLSVNDVCSVSGQGSLTVTASASVSLLPNPLASVSLPLQAGTFQIQDGVLSEIGATFTLTGSYEVRVEKTTASTIRLSYIRQRSTALEVDAGASAGVAVTLGSKDLLAKVLGEFEQGGVDPKVLSSLSTDEIGDFSGAVKSGLDHSLAASLNLALSRENDAEAAFQYELNPAKFDDDSAKAVTRALRGDLTVLSALESKAEADGAIMAGVRLLNSVTSTARKRGASLKVNLLGIVNLITMSELLDQCEFLYEPSSGDVTIKETAQSEKISAITDPARKQAALQKALFDSVLATTTYVTGRAVTMPSLGCEAVHFTANRNTSAGLMRNYTNWFTTLHLLTEGERSALLSQFSGGGESRCTLRVRLDNTRCEALFFDGAGNLRKKADYAEVGRHALQTLIDPGGGTADRIRYQVMDDSGLWKKAMEIGPSPQLGQVIPLASSDPAFSLALGAVTGDVYDIAWWAESMESAGEALQGVRNWLAGRDSAAVAGDAQFIGLRNKLQQAMMTVVKNSRMRFDKPWGIVCLFEAAGSSGASGQIMAQGIALDKIAAVAIGA